MPCTTIPPTIITTKSTTSLCNNRVRSPAPSEAKLAVDPSLSIPLISFRLCPPARSAFGTTKNLLTSPATSATPAATVENVLKVHCLLEEGDWGRTRSRRVLLDSAILPSEEHAEHQGCRESHREIGNITTNRGRRHQASERNEHGGASKA